MYKKRLTRRDFLKLTGTVASGALLASCTPKSDQTSGVTDPKSPVELKMWVHWGGVQLEILQKTIDAYNQTAGEEIGTTVLLETVITNEMRQKMTAAKLAGTSPDIYHVGISVLDLIANNVINPLPVEEQDYVNKNYVQAAVDRVSFGGKVWAYPTEHQANALIYRKSVFDKFGITELPQNTDELRSLAKELTYTEDGTKYYGMTLWHDGLLLEFQNLIWRFGGDYLKFDGDTPVRFTMDTDEAAEALNFWVGMVDDGSTNAGEMGIFDAWANGLGVMAEVEPWFPLEVLRNGGREDLYDDLGIVAIPPAPGVSPVAMAGGWQMVADSTSEHPEEVFHFMSYLMHKPDMPFSKFIVEGIGSLPAPTEYPLPIESWSDSMNEGYAKQTTPITRLTSLDRCIGQMELRTAIQQAIQPVLLKQAEIKPTLADLEKQLNEILDRTDGARRS